MDFTVANMGLIVADEGSQLNDPHETYNRRVRTTSDSIPEKRCRQVVLNAHFDSGRCVTST